MTTPPHERLTVPDDLGEQLRSAWLAEGRTYVIEADADGTVFYSDLLTGEVITHDEARRRRSSGEATIHHPIGPPH